MLEAELRRSPEKDSPFFYATDRPQYCDVATFDVLDSVLSGVGLFGYDDIMDYPRLCALLRAVRTDDELADYLRVRGDVIGAIVKGLVG